MTPPVTPPIMGGLRPPIASPREDAANKRGAPRAVVTVKALCLL
jgi:hypothetical protein